HLVMRRGTWLPRAGVEAFHRCPRRRSLTLPGAWRGIGLETIAPLQASSRTNARVRVADPGAQPSPPVTVKTRQWDGTPPSARFKLQERPASFAEALVRAAAGRAARPRPGSAPRRWRPPSRVVSIHRR